MSGKDSFIESQDFIRLNVCGQKFQIKRETVLKYPTTRLGRIAQGKKSSINTKSQNKISLFDGKAKGEIYFERDPTCIPSILSFYITDILHIPRHICIEAFQMEMEYWAIPFTLDSCCEGFHQQEWELIETVKKTNEIFEDSGHRKNKTNKEGNNDDSKESGSEINLNRETCWTKNKPILWDLFENPGSSKYASEKGTSQNVDIKNQLISIVSSLAVIISTITLCVNTLPEVQHVLPNGDTTDNKYILIVEAVCIFWFTVEYIIRVSSTPNKTKFLKSIMNAIDLLSVVPFYVGVIVDESTNDTFESFTEMRRLVQILRIFRIVRIFKLARHSTGLQVLGYTVRNSGPELGLLFLLLLMGMTLFSCLMYYAEQSAKNSPFTSVIAGFWYTLITMTTVGYGDMTPVTVPGKVIGACCCISGILFIALPIPTIVSNFSAFYKDHLNKEKLHKLYEVGQISLDFPDASESSSSILVTGPTKSIFNCNTIPNPRVSIAQLEMHDKYRRRMSSHLGPMPDFRRVSIHPSRLHHKMEVVKNMV